MTDEKQLVILRQGIETWNAWRQKLADQANDLYASNASPNLNKAQLSGFQLENFNLAHASLIGARLITVNLTGANLTGANLAYADLFKACLAGARLDNANLGDANLSGADLTGTRLVRAHLAGANFVGAKLTRADLTGASLRATIFGQTDLNRCKGLGRCRHIGPSIVDIETLQRSGPLPLAFLRGVGLPETLIGNLPSLLNQPIRYYSPFISYSSKDQAFADRLYADLQSKGVRCYFAPEDLKIGDHLEETIDKAIRQRDKLLLILSGTSVASTWVRREVRIALEEEERHGRPMLFPIRLDDAVMDTTEQWAHDIRRTRYIGNFTRWEERDAYHKGLKRLLRNLKVEAASLSPAG